MSARPKVRPTIDARLLIDGSWVEGAEGRTLPVIDPSLGEPAGRVAVAAAADLARSVEAAQQGFAAWRAVAPFDVRAC
ncbi:MAG: aldehyde dehydrogenase family protein [Steroidobacteraceae bacterium]